ncbi:hypothetical protein LEL_02911 [Akanthomyces lecanii RCEF 1005]|uniref:Uncharacterized protein n=1 Tax=Akanthomyces lecanii RCEF 1005 TaxID=1081108 RepID=A0A168IM60_CORDF|nr:hypothetical protein LEL_02911 [Akanthomyces lecanii RCEF 1005]
MRFQNLLAGVALASAAAAQFVFPDASASLQVNKAIQIQWNKAGLQAPLSINLVPAGASIRQDVVLKQVAGMGILKDAQSIMANVLTVDVPVNIGNAGILQWTADETITAFPKFAMVIIDARAKVVVSQPFVIQSLTRQPTQQIDLGNGNGGGKNGNKQAGDKAGKPNNEANNKDKNKDNSKDANKDANKDGKKEEKVTDKEESNDSSKTSLLPLPGLPASDEAPVSLKPLPTVASVPSATQIAAPASSTVKSTSKPTTKSASQEKPSTSEAAPAVPLPTPSTSPAVEAGEAGKEPAAAQPAQNGFTTLQPSAEPVPATPSAAPAEKAAVAAMPDGALKAEAVVAGGSFREQTSEMAVLTSLPSQEGQETITTAITPRPAKFASSTLNGLAESASPTTLGETKPTALSENGVPRPCPSLVLGLLGAVACLALL